MKIIFAAAKYDYGNKERGFSFERENFFPELLKLSDEIIEFDFLSLYQDYGKVEMNQRLKQLVISEKPNLIFFSLTNDEFEPEILEFIKNNTDTVSINWFSDDQWRFDNFSRIFAPYFNYVITTDKLAIDKYKAIGVGNVILSQWATGVDKQIDFDRVEYKYDVSFIGLKNEYREWFINILEKRGFNVACFGHGWKNGRIDYEEMQNIFLTSKINLNISNSSNYDIRYIFSSLKSFYSVIKSILFKKSKDAEQIKARHFEIGGAGGFQLTNYVPFLEDYFKIGLEIQVYSNIDDLVDKIKYYLKNESERMIVTKNGHDLINQQHKYSMRFKELLRAISA